MWLVYYSILIFFLIQKVNGDFCHPAKCADGTCYCTDREDGWYDGGGFCSKNLRSCGCLCSAGDFYAMTSCYDYRCPDTHTYVPNDPSGVPCRGWDDNKGPLFSVEQVYDFCYKKKEICNYKRCDYGESLVGCGRASAGTCQKCPDLSPGKYWTSKSTCTQSACSVAPGGKFIAKSCTSTADTVLANCAGYPGNKGYIVPNIKDTYYCPGNGLVLPLPENSQATADYSSFECLPGFYQEGSSCLQCTPGFACKHGRKFECPVHYYSSTFGMSHCTICTRQCSGSWQHPLRCPQGSTANPGCISCGACDYDPKRGISCVMEAYEMQGLPDKCIPMDVQGGVAVCQ